VTDLSFASIEIKFWSHHLSVVLHSLDCTVPWSMRWTIHFAHLAVAISKDLHTQLHTIANT
jgi:hypothetical protein